MDDLLPTLAPPASASPLPYVHVVPALDGRNSVPLRSICDLARAELVADGLRLREPCWKCGHAVHDHRGSVTDPLVGLPPVPVAVDPVAVPTGNAAGLPDLRKSLADLIKLVQDKSFPRWKTGETDAATFCADLELRLKSYTTVPSTLYGRVFGLVMPIAMTRSGVMNTLFVRAWTGLLPALCSWSSSKTLPVASSSWCSSIPSTVRLVKALIGVVSVPGAVLPATARR